MAFHFKKRLSNCKIHAAGFLADRHASRTNLLIIYQFPITFSIFPLDSVVRKTTDPFNSFARVYARSPILWLYMFLWHCVVFVHIILSFKSRSIALKCTKSQYSSVHDIMIPCDRITACFRSSPK